MVRPIVSRSRCRKAANVCSHSRLAFVQLRLVQRADLVGDSEHRHPPREDFVAQERKAIALADGGAPREDRIERIPILGKRGGERLKRLPLAGVYQRAILRESRIHIVARFEQAVAMPFGFARFGLEQVIADVGARNVDIAADALKQSRAQQEVFANLIVGALDALKSAHAIDFRERHHGQQAAEPGHQGE